MVANFDIFSQLMSLLTVQRFLRSLRGTSTDRSQLAWTGTSLRPVCAGPYRLSKGLCRLAPVSRRDHKKRCI